MLLEKCLNNYINIFETEMRGNMFDVDSIQVNHLKKVEEVKNENQKYMLELE